MKVIGTRPEDIFCMALVFAAVSEQVAKAAGLDNMCPFIHLKNGTTTLRSSGQQAVFECQPGLQLLGPSNSSCIRKAWNPPVPVCVKAGCTAITTIRNGNISQESHNGAVLYFKCDPGYFSKDSPVVYCNGYRWNSTKFECQANYKTPKASCDFESVDLCGWVHRDSNNDSYNWRRHSGSTPSRIVGTGPWFDHTLGPSHAGHYMYIEGSVGQTNDTAFLYSSVYSPSPTRRLCFYFWYHMFGATTGVLKVYVKPEGLELNQLKPLFLKEGHQKDAWLPGFFPVNRTDKPFQIVFEGVHGHGYTSDIAIDDVRLVDDDCSAQVALETVAGGESVLQWMTTTLPLEEGRPWVVGLVVGLVLAVGVVGALVTVGVVLVKRRRVEGGRWEASPDDAYVRYMSHQEALVQDDSDSSDGHVVL